MTRRAASGITIRTNGGSSAGIAMTTPVSCTLMTLGSNPSRSEANGLLPAQATAHSPITCSARSLPAS